MCGSTWGPGRDYVGVFDEKVNVPSMSAHTSALKSAKNLEHVFDGPSGATNLDYNVTVRECYPFVVKLCNRKTDCGRRRRIFVGSTGRLQSSSTRAGSILTASDTSTAIDIACLLQLLTAQATGRAGMLCSQNAEVVARVTLNPLHPKLASSVIGNLPEKSLKQQMTATNC